MQVLGSSTMSSDLERLAEFDQQVENLLQQQQQQQQSAETRHAETEAAAPPPPAAAAAAEIRARANTGGEAMQAAEAARASMPQQAQRQPQVAPRAAAAAAAADLAALDLSSSIETDPGRNDLEVRPPDTCLLQCLCCAVIILGAVLNRPAVSYACPVCANAATLQPASSTSTVSLQVASCPILCHILISSSVLVSRRLSLSASWRQTTPAAY
jgi:hypothetical protein